MAPRWLLLFLLLVPLPGCHILERANQCQALSNSLNQAKTELEKLHSEGPSSYVDLPRNAPLHQAQREKLISNLQKLEQGLNEVLIEPSQLKTQRKRLSKSVKELRAFHQQAAHNSTKLSKRAAKALHLRLIKKVSLTKRELKELQALCL